MTTTPQADPDQLAMMSELLEGADADSYVVMPVGALVSQLTVALNETRDGTGYRPGRAAARLARNLGELGFIVTVRRPPQATR